MKKNIVLLLTAILLCAPLASIAQSLNTPSGVYELEKNHGYITFSYFHLGFSRPHVGFDSFDVSLDLDSENVENSSLSVNIDASSINSRVPLFNEHLNGEEFFDTENHPNISFVSTSISSTGENTYDVTGDLTIKGITHSVTLSAIINRAAVVRDRTKIGISAETEVLRSEWGLSRDTSMTSDEVKISIEVELMKS